MSGATLSLQYFYMAGDQRRGPFSFEQLLQQPMHRETPIWCKGMADWQPTANLPQLTGLVPPAPPHAAADQAAFAALPPSTTGLKAYAGALVVVNVGILMFIILSLLVMAFSEGAYGPMYWIEAVLRAGLIFYAAAKVRYRMPWLWAAGGLVPLAWLVVLLVLHSRLKTPLIAAGYRISFFGRATPPAEERV